MFYQSIRETLNSKSKLIPINEDVKKYIRDTNKDYYTSIFHYSEEHKKLFDETGTIRGIRDTTTDKLVFDFDDKDNIENAKKDAVLLASKLIEKYNVPEESIQAFFSGKKGFTLEVNLADRITQEEFKATTLSAASELKSFDTVVNDSNRVIRVPNTRHQDTGLFKVPLELYELDELSIDQIKHIATKPRFLNKKIIRTTFPIQKVVPVKLEKKVTIIEAPIDFTKKASFLTNCRYALQNGLFNEGARSNALLCLAATYKNQGFDIEHTYRFLKGVCELQSRRTGNDRFPDEELYNNVCLQVYSPHWKGGQYSCRVEGWLKDYCESLGHNKCKHNEESTTVTAEDAFNNFADYALHHKENVLYTGIKSLDERMKLMVGTSNAFVASPGVGKSSLSLELLNYNSSQGIPSLFFSYDMFSAALYMRMIQRHTGLNQNKVYEYAESNPKKMAEIKEILKKEYENVRFCFKSGQTIDELESTIVETEEKMGKKLKLVIVDYNELVATNLSDATASSALVAQRLRQIANDKKVCIVTLLQPSKLYSSPSDEVTNFNAAKGSSAITQSLTVMLGLSRPGFNPLNPETDKYFNITCLKNRNGPLFSVDLGWEGLRGSFTELEDHEVADLQQIRDAKNAQKASKDPW